MPTYSYLQKAAQNVFQHRMLAKDDMAQPAPQDKVKFDPKQAIFATNVDCDISKNAQGKELERIKFFNQPEKKPIKPEDCNKKCVDDW